MSKRVMVAVLALMLALIPSVALADYNSGKIVIVGAEWDMPLGVSPTVDTSITLNKQETIEIAAEYLSRSKNLIVAGGPGGTVNEEMYQDIIEGAAKLNPDHGGSIVRIGGKDKEETRQFINSYLSSLRIFY